MQTQIPEDQVFKLLAKAKQGDINSFRLIIRSYQRYGFAVAFKILCNEDDAKDVVQESFIRIWKNISSFNYQNKFSTWMYKIVVNLCYDKLKEIKRSNRRIEKYDNNEIERLFINEHNLEQEISNKELAAKIKLISNDLPAKQRTIFVLRDLEGLSIAEVTQITEMSEAAVKTNLVYARRSIREKLIKWMK